jgi:dihydroorotase
MTTTLILNAKIVNEGSTTEQDIFIRNGMIECIAKNLQHLAADDIIDAKNLYLLPGMIDDQVHFREPGLMHKGDIASESRAAVAGGITSYMEMPNVNPPSTNAIELDKKFALAAQKSLANYSFYLGATNNNIEDIKRVDKNKICGVKVFMGASTGNLLVDDHCALDAIFESCPILIATHCEDPHIILRNEATYRKLYGESIPLHLHPTIRSEAACYASTAYAINLAKKHQSDLHVLHISTHKELALFSQGDIRHKKITAEACAHFLWFSDEDYKTQGALIKCNPAIKRTQDRAALISAINNDVIDIIATDHAPHTLEEKQQSYFKAPSGLPLVQHALLSLLTKVNDGVFTLEKIVEKTAHNPAIRYKVAKRGFIKEGFYADVVLVDMNNSTFVDKASLLYKCQWSPFEGQTFTAKVISTFVNGVKVYDAVVGGDQKIQHVPIASRALEFCRD